MTTSKVDTQLANELWQEYYARHGRGWLTVVTGSMMPLIHIGNRVLVSRTEPALVRTGDLIAFRREGNHIVHRVLDKRVTNDGLVFVEKGDAAGTLGTFHERDIIGRIIAVRHGSSIFKLDSFIGRKTAGFFAWWTRDIRPVITRLYHPRRRVFTLPGRLASLPFRAANKFIIHASRFTWYLCGLTSGKDD